MAPIDEEIWFNADEYTTAFLHPDWLYFLWHALLVPKSEVTCTYIAPIEIIVLNEKYFAARFCGDFETLEVVFHPFEDEPEYISNTIANHDITCFISRL